MLPLSISNIEAIDPFKFNFCERNIAKTAAASVDAITDPISKPSNKEVLKTIEENNPVKPAVITTPNDDISID